MTGPLTGPLTGLLTGLRSAAFAAWFYGLTTLMLLAAPLLLPAGEAVALGYARVWVRLVLGGLRVLCGITWEVSGLEHVPPTGPALIASMHQSAFDTLIWAILAPRFSYVLKQELLRIPLFGLMLRRTGMIPVDRSGGATALRALLRAADRAVAQRRCIVIFPEGTRVAPGQSVRLLPGVAALAAHCGLPVIPVATDSGRLWARRGLRRQAGVIRIAILPPVPAGLPRHALLARLQADFTAGAASLAHAVDNPVGECVGGLPVRSS